MFLLAGGRAAAADGIGSAQRPGQGPAAAADTPEGLQGRCEQPAEGNQGRGGSESAGAADEWRQEVRADGPSQKWRQTILSSTLPLPSQLPSPPDGKCDPLTRAAHRRMRTSSRGCCRSTRAPVRAPKSYGRRACARGCGEAGDLRASLAVAFGSLVCALVRGFVRGAPPHRPSLVTAWLAPTADRPRRQRLRPRLSARTS